MKCKIVSMVYLGSRRDATRPDAPSVQVVCEPESDFLPEKDRQYHVITREGRLQARLNDMCVFVQNHLRQDKTIMFWCESGKEGAPAYVLAFLVYYSMTLKDAWSLLRNKHAYPRPDRAMWRGLQKFESSIVPTTGLGRQPHAKPILHLNRPVRRKKGRRSTNDRSSRWDKARLHHLRAKSLTRKRLPPIGSGGLRRGRRRRCLTNASRRARSLAPSWGWDSAFKPGASRASSNIPDATPSTCVLRVPRIMEPTPPSGTRAYTPVPSAPPSTPELWSPS